MITDAVAAKESGDQQDGHGGTTRIVSTLDSAEQPKVRANGSNFRSSGGVFEPTVIPTQKRSAIVSDGALYCGTNFG